MAGIHSATVHWEAVYQDGFILREADGHRYKDIDRNQLREFRLVSPGEVLAALFTGQDGVTGWNLVYRRRTIMSVGAGKTVWFVLGWVPQGPILAIQPETLQLLQDDRFHTSEAGPLGAPQPIPEEGEHWDLTHLQHRTDARLTPNQITLPSGYRMAVNGGRA